MIKKLFKKILPVIVSLLLPISAFAVPGGDLNLQNKASLTSRAGYKLTLGTASTDNLEVIQNNALTLRINGSTKEITVPGSLSVTGTITGTLGSILANNTYLKAANSVTGNNNLLKSDASDNTLINSPSGKAVILQLSEDANRLITVGASSDTSFTFQYGDNTAAQQLAISAATTDGADTGRVQIAGGGAGFSSARGSTVTVFGNEHATLPGSIQLTSGPVTGAEILLDTRDTAGIIRFSFNNDANRQMQWSSGSDTIIEQTFGDAGVTALQEYYIRARTSDADDDAAVIVAAGGSSSASRGAKAAWYGNEVASVGGSSQITGGAISTGNVTLQTQHASASVRLNPGAATTDYLSFGSSGNTNLTAKFGDAGVTAAQTFAITASTSDADDDSLTAIGGGGLALTGDAAQTRGAFCQFAGNESASTGRLDCQAGNVSGANINLLTRAASTTIILGINAASDFTLSSTGGLFTGTVTSSRATDLGWSVVNAVNQACNTTCTSACVVGIDTLGTGGFLSCATATADSCICAGAS